MNKLIVILALAFALNPAQAESLGEKIRDRIETQDIDLNLDILNLDVGDNASIDIDGGIRVFPNEDGQTYSRSEPLRFRFQVGNHIDIGALQVGGSSTIGLDGEFIRQFESQRAAFNVISNPPYIFDRNRIVTADRIPITAERAKSLKHGDYFRYQVRAAISARAGVGTDLGLVDVPAGYTRVFYGDFQIEVYKQANNKVYVRASSLKQTTRNFSFGIDRGFVFDAFDIPEIDKIVDRILPDTFLKVDVSNMAKGKIFAIEYLFDLNQPAAAEAYNQFMYYRNWKVMDVARVINPLRGGSEAVRNTLTMHLEETERLAYADASRRESDARVRRISKSETQFSNNSRGGHINIRLVRLSDRTRFVEQNIRLTVDPLHNYNQFYRIATTDFTKEWGGWLALGNEEQKRGEANILFEMNPNMTIKDFMELNFSYEETDNTFRKGGTFVTSDIAQISGRIYKMLPGYLHGPERDRKDAVAGPGVRGFVYDELPKYIGDSVFIDLDVIVSKQALTLAATLSNAEIQQVIDQFIDSVFEDQSINGINKRDYGDMDLDEEPLHDVRECKNSTNRWETRQCLEAANGKSVEKIKRLIPRILAYASSGNYEEQWRNLVFLQNDPLFRSIGSGIITRLVFKACQNKEKYFEDYVYYKMSIQNTDDQKSVYEKGLANRPDVFNELLKIRNRILNRRYDPSYFEQN